MSAVYGQWETDADFRAWQRAQYPSQGDAFLKHVVHGVAHKAHPQPIENALAALDELDRRAKAGEYGPRLLAEFAEMRRWLETKVAA